MASVQFGSGYAQNAMGVVCDLAFRPAGEKWLRHRALRPRNTGRWWIARCVARTPARASADRELRSGEAGAQQVRIGLLPQAYPEVARCTRRTRPGTPPSLAPAYSAEGAVR